MHTTQQYKDKTLVRFALTNDTHTSSLRVSYWVSVVSYTEMTIYREHTVPGSQRIFHFEEPVMQSIDDFFVDSPDDVWTKSQMVGYIWPQMTNEM